MRRLELSKELDRLAFQYLCELVYALRTGPRAAARLKSILIGSIVPPSNPEAISDLLLGQFKFRSPSRQIDAKYLVCIHIEILERLVFEGYALNRDIKWSRLK